jgi:predicted ChrR family anti-sigma factor
MGHLHDRIDDLAFTRAPTPAEQAHLDACPECAALLDAALETLSNLAEDLPAALPSPALEARILAIGTWEDHAAAMSQLAGIDVPRARAILRDALDPASWISGIPGVRFQHFSVGADLAGAEAGLVYLDAGAAFPAHGHGGGEETLVLEGTLVEDSGRSLGPGGRWTMAAGAVHALRAGPGGPCVYVTVIRGGIEFQ